MPRQRVAVVITLSVVRWRHPEGRRVNCDKTEEKSVQIFTALHGMPYKRPFILVFWEKEWLGGNHFHLKFWVYRLLLEPKMKFVRCP